MNLHRLWNNLGALAVLCSAVPLETSQAATDSQVRPWPEYRAIMWIGDSAYKKPEKTALFFQRLREMGIDTGMVYGEASPQRLLDNKFPYYVENIINRGLCLKWNSKVRDWDKFVTGWAKGGRLESGLVRDYCLDDPQWRGWAEKQMQSAVRKNLANQPLAYDIRDELSTTISANPFDYDFNPVTLENFRAWLKTQYPSLQALNEEWETAFSAWAEVKPFTTDQIKNRMGSGDARPRGRPDWQAVQRLKFEPAAARQSPTRWNFSPWADFRTYMDISLAGALDSIRQAAHAVDPHTPVGIEGTQMPHAFGGYDLWRLSQVLDWVEPYDIGSSREIFGSFMPGKPMVTTVFEKETNPARRRLWHLLLEGDKGCIIWWSEDCIDWKSEDYALTSKAKALAPVLEEMRSPLAKIFLRAKRQYDPILIHYSQPSIQVDWLLESTVDGSTWLRRFSSFEADHNRMAKVRNSWLKAFQDLGYSPRFISSEELTRKGLIDQCVVLVLPTSLALSSLESRRIEDFFSLFEETVNRVIFADGTPGLFDEHGKLRQAGPFDRRFPLATSQQCSYAFQAPRQKLLSKNGEVAAYARQRLAPEPNLEWAKWIAGALQMDKQEAAVPLEARARIYRYHLGDARLLAFERNINYHMSEDLKQAGGNEALEKPADVEAALAQPAHVYDLRTRQYLGQTARLRFRLDPWQPSLFALLPKPIPAETLMDYLLKL